MSTHIPKIAEGDRRWYVIDARGQVLGKLASTAAQLLSGKRKAVYTPFLDTGDHVIVINADKVELTGNKATQKVAYRHSGYPGGITGVRYDTLLADRPIAAVEKAVRGMLPKNRLGRQMIKKLHVVAGPEHPHQAQQPVALTVGERPAWDGLPVPAPKPAPVAKAVPVVEEAPKDAPAKRSAAKKPKAEPAESAEVVEAEVVEAEAVEAPETGTEPIDTDTTEE
jgi:large subunit ribosomal protein L13